LLSWGFAELPFRYVALFIMDFFLFNFISITKVYYEKPKAFQMKNTIDFYMQVFFAGISPKT
jgi:hypothetical protein